MLFLYWTRATYRTRDGKFATQETVQAARSVQALWDEKWANDAARNARWEQFPKRGWRGPPKLVALAFIRPPAYLTAEEKNHLAVWQDLLDRGLMSR